VATAIDLGVASGSVSIMAGIYFKFTEKTDANGNATSPGSTVVITGFVRADGKLEVLDLISVSLEFYLGLTYTSTGNKLEGDCVLSVSVSVACFSTTVQLSMHKEFSAGSDPTFGSQLTAGEWDTYCAAFAA
jgi:hypothetical protein